MYPRRHLALVLVPADGCCSAVTRLLVKGIEPLGKDELTGANPMQRLWTRMPLRFEAGSAKKSAKGGIE
jgi:hypothetical protein